MPTLRGSRGSSGRDVAAKGVVYADLAHRRERLRVRRDGGSKPPRVSREGCPRAFPEPIRGLQLRGRAPRGPLRAPPPPPPPPNPDEGRGQSGSLGPRESTVAIARAPIPSPRPTQPIPSPVVNLTFTAPGSRPSASASRVAHPLPIVAQLRRLAQHRRVDVHGRKAHVADHCPHGPQQLDRVGVPPALVSVREVHPDVPQPRRADQRVHHGVCENVGVGPAGEATGCSPLPRPRPGARPSTNRCESQPTPGPGMAHPSGSSRRARRSNTAISVTPRSWRNGTARSYSYPSCSGRWASLESATGRPASRHISRKAPPGRSRAPACAALRWRPRSPRPTRRSHPSRVVEPTQVAAGVRNAGRQRP